MSEAPAKRQRIGDEQLGVDPHTRQQKAELQSQSDNSEQIFHIQEKQDDEVRQRSSQKGTTHYRNYVQLDANQKAQLHDLVFNQRRTIKDAAAIMGVHYSTAKYIVKAYRKKNIAEKLQEAKTFEEPPNNMTATTVTATVIDHHATQHIPLKREAPHETVQDSGKSLLGRLQRALVTRRESILSVSDNLDGATLGNTSQLPQTLANIVQPPSKIPLHSFRATSQRSLINPVATINMNSYPGQPSANMPSNMLVGAGSSPNFHLQLPQTQLQIQTHDQLKTYEQSLSENSVSVSDAPQGDKQSFSSLNPVNQLVQLHNLLNDDRATAETLNALQVLKLIEILDKKKEEAMQTLKKFKMT